MNVFAIVGPSGSGKSSLVKSLASIGFTTLVEDYLNSCPERFSNKHLLSKWNWVALWLTRVWDFRQQGTIILVTNRFPLEVVPYATSGVFLLEPIKHTLEELEDYGVFIRTIYLQVPLDICLDRCKRRLRTEPHRKAYGENNREFIKSVYAFYEKGIGNLWDFTIDTRGKSIGEVTEEAKTIIEGVAYE